MPRRIIGPPSECIVCIAIDNHHLSTLESAFLRGYVAGVHGVSKGDLANERLCPAHATDLAEALAFYVGGGQAFPPTSTRVDVLPVEPVLRPSGTEGPPGPWRG